MKVLRFVEPVVEYTTGPCHPLVESGPVDSDTDISESEKRIYCRWALLHLQLGAQQETLHRDRLLLFAHAQGKLSRKWDVQPVVENGELICFFRVKTLVERMGCCNKSVDPGSLEVQGSCNTESECSAVATKRTTCSATCGSIKCLAWATTCKAAAPFMR